jgi:hypothetical protein
MTHVVRAAFPLPPLVLPAGAMLAPDLAFVTFNMAAAFSAPLLVVPRMCQTAEQSQ